MLNKLSSTFKVALALMFAVLSSGLMQVGTAYAFQAPTKVLAHNAKIDICQSTRAHDNPYVHASVNVNSLEGHGSSAPSNTIGVWYDGIEDKGWGDIIPPFTWKDNKGVEQPFEGLNWEEGQAIYKNDCNIPTSNQPEPTEVSVANAPYAAEPTCEADGYLVLPTNENITWTGAVDGDGPGTYTINANADTDYTLVGKSSWTLTVKPKLNNWIECGAYIETSHTYGTCGQITIHMTNKSAWLYVTLVRINGVYVPVNDRITLDNRTDTNGDGELDTKGPIKYTEASKTFTFDEDEYGGEVEVAYIVWQGSESKLWEGKDVGKWTKVNVNTNCQDDETPLPAGIANICGIGNDTVPHTNTNYYTVSNDTGWEQDGNDSVKKVRTITYQASDSYKFPQSQGWDVSPDGKTATYTYTDLGTPCTTVCTEIPVVHATNQNLNGWTLGTGAEFVSGGINLQTPGNWNDSSISRTMTGTLYNLGDVIDFLPNQQFLGLHVKTAIGTLTYEKHYENQDPVHAGKWWSQSEFGVASGQGYPTFDTLDNIIAKNPDLAIESLTVLYTGPTAANSVVTSVKIACNEYTFDLTTKDKAEDETGVLGAEKPQGDKQLPAVLPATGNELSFHLIGALLAALTYAVMLRRRPDYQTQ